MLLISAKCPVRPSTPRQGPPPTPRSPPGCPGRARRMLFLCTVPPSHWMGFNRILLMPVCIMVKILKSGLNLADCCLLFGLLGISHAFARCHPPGAPQEAHPVAGVRRRVGEWSWEGGKRGEEEREADQRVRGKAWATILCQAALLPTLQGILKVTFRVRCRSETEQEAAPGPSAD